MSICLYTPQKKDVYMYLNKQLETKLCALNEKTQLTNYNVY